MTVPKMAAIVCLVTMPNKTKGQRMARELLRLRLAACVNIIGSIESQFIWHGKMDKASEALLIIKTERSRFAELERAIQKMHPYAVPEIIALPVVAGHGPYLKWLHDTIR